VSLSLGLFSSHCCQWVFGCVPSCAVVHMLATCTKVMVTGVLFNKLAIKTLKS
jgi:hypothetical protein